MKGKTSAHIPGKLQTPGKPGMGPCAAASARREDYLGGNRASLRKSSTSNHVIRRGKRLPRRRRRAGKADYSRSEVTPPELGSPSSAPRAGAGDGNSGNYWDMALFGVPGGFHWDSGTLRDDAASWDSFEITAGNGAGCPPKDPRLPPVIVPSPCPRHPRHSRREIPVLPVNPS